MTSALLDAAMALGYGLAAGGAGWWARDATIQRRYRRIADAVRAERMGP